MCVCTHYMSRHADRFHDFARSIWHVYEQKRANKKKMKKERKNRICFIRRTSEPFQA